MVGRVFLQIFPIQHRLQEDSLGIINQLQGEERSVFFQQAKEDKIPFPQIQGRDLFGGNNPREKILVFEVV